MISFDLSVDPSFIMSTSYSLTFCSKALLSMVVCGEPLVPCAKPESCVFICVLLATNNISVLKHIIRNNHINSF